MSRRATRLAAPIILLAVAVATLGVFLDVTGKLPISNQAPTAISKDLADLPETSAIKQALLERERAKARKRAEEDLAVEKRNRNEASRAVASQYGDLGFDYPDYLNKFAEGYPYYAQCLDKEKPIDSPGGYYLTRDCVKQSFILDRLNQNEAMKKAFRLSKQAGLNIQLTDSFGLTSDGSVIFVNINADDETIVNYLTKSTVFKNCGTPSSNFTTWNLCPADTKP